MPEDLDVGDIPVFLTRVVLDREPVSINKAYTTFRGKRNLTKAGKAFKDALSSAIAASSYDWKRAVEATYQLGGRAELRVLLYFPDLYNRTWTRGGKVETRYKRKDASNYLKLTEDAMTSGSGIDDCFNVDIRIGKRHSPSSPRVEVIFAVYVDDPEDWARLMEGDG